MPLQKVVGVGWGLKSNIKVLATLKSFLGFFERQVKFQEPTR
jgi:hypothetical protein